MQTRTKLVFIIALGLVMFFFGAYLIYQTFMGTRPADDPLTSSGGLVQTADTLPSSGGKNTPNVQEQPNTTAPTPVVDKMRGLENQARATVERIGSGSSQTGFLGYGDVLTSCTPELQTWLAGEQKKLQDAHPATGPLYTMTTRAVSAHAANSAKFGDDTVKVTVQAIQIDNQLKAGESRAKQVTFTFTKQSEESYLVSKIEWSDLEL